VQRKINATAHLPTRLGDTDEEEIYSDHPGGAFVLFADGSVKFLDEELDLVILHALCTRNGEREFGENRDDPRWPPDLK